MLCFSYGSNRSLKRLQARVPSARLVAPTTLVGHRLRFHKVDGSGKGNAEETGNPLDEVIGVVYQIDDEDKSILDGYEGLGYGYDEKQVDVTTAQRQLRALVYIATHIDSSLKPYRWYLQHVLVGAREKRLPPDYIAYGVM